MKTLNDCLNICALGPLSTAKLLASLPPDKAILVESYLIAAQQNRRSGYSDATAWATMQHVSKLYEQFATESDA